MNGIEIFAGKIKMSSEFEMVKTVAKFLTTSKNLVLSDTELYALTMFIIKGYNKVVKEELITIKLLKSSNAVANLLSRFRKFGILNKTVKGEELSEDYKFYSENLKAIKFGIILHT
jgi:hypothetical protein